MRRPSPQQASINFGFLAKHDPTTARFAGFAELYCSSDPNTALVELRQLIERLAQLAASRVGIEAGLDLRALIEELRSGASSSLKPPRRSTTSCKQGNRTVYETAGTPGEAVHALRDTGVVQFHRLRRGGPLYRPSTLPSVPPLAAGLLDEPAPCEVRAILRNARVPAVASRRRHRPRYRNCDCRRDQAEGVREVGSAGVRLMYHGRQSGGRKISPVTISNYS